MRSISAILPTLPGFPAPQIRAPWPVWRDSVVGPVRFAPMTRKATAALWHKLRAWDRDSHRHGRHGGLLTHLDLKVYYVLAFDFLNYATGRLDPSLDQIAEKARCCRRAVGNALARLRARGLLIWQRRCEEDRDEQGRFRLRQRTNAYALLPTSQWIGYREKLPPAPTRDTLGYPEPIPSPIEAAVAELTHGHRKASLAALEADPHDALALALAAFSRAVEAREAEVVIGVHGLLRNPPQSPNHISPDRSAASEPDPQSLSSDLEATKAYWIARLSSPDKTG